MCLLDGWLQAIFRTLKQFPLFIYLFIFSIGVYAYGAALSYSQTGHNV
jgi:hypothetical protein